MKCNRCGATANKKGMPFTYFALLGHKRACVEPLNRAAENPAEVQRLDANEINAGTAERQPYISSLKEETNAASDGGVESNKPISLPLPPRSLLLRRFKLYGDKLNDFQRPILKAYLMNKPIADKQWVGLWGAIETMEDIWNEEQARLPSPDEQKAREEEAAKAEAERLEREAEKVRNAEFWRRTDEEYQVWANSQPPSEIVDDEFIDEFIAPPKRVRDNPPALPRGTVPAKPKKKPDPSKPKPTTPVHKRPIFRPKPRPEPFWDDFAP